MGTSLSTSLVRAATVGAVLACIPLAAAPVAAQSGVTFTYDMKTSSSAAPQRQQGGPMTMTANVRAAGPNMRVDWTSTAPGNPMMKPGSYILLRGADQAFIIVSPQDKSAMRMDAEGFGSGTGSITNNALVKVSQKDSKFDFEELGAGDRILGYPTRHVRITSSGTTEIRMMGRTTSATQSSVSDAWIATSIKGVDAEALRQWGKAFGRGLQRTNADLVPRLADYEKKYGDGFALRSVVISSRNDDKGRASTDTIRMEVTQLAPATLDPSVFEVPKDYQVADMRQMAAALDSARKSGGADSASGSIKENAIKGALGGFLKRKKP